MRRDCRRIQLRENVVVLRLSRRALSPKLAHLLLSHTDAAGLAHHLESSRMGAPERLQKPGTCRDGFKQRTAKPAHLKDEHDNRIAKVWDELHLSLSGLMCPTNSKHLAFAEKPKASFFFFCVCVCVGVRTFRVFTAMLPGTDSCNGHYHHRDNFFVEE